MGKSKVAKKAGAAVVESATTVSSKNSLAAISGVDSSLASLFASSAGPVRSPPPRSHTKAIAEPAIKAVQVEGSPISPDLSEASSQQSRASTPTSLSSSEPDEEETPPKKRRKVKEVDDLEARYLDRLAQEEAHDGESEQDAARKRADQQSSESEGQDLNEDEVPKHETLTDGDASRQIAKRTVFLGNVSVEAIKSKSAKKTLLKHMSSFFSELPAHDQSSNIESLRFRSTAYADAGLPKKAAFAKKEVMEATTKSTNAYVVYSTETAARKAARMLNGTVVLGRHLRVDHVAHPAPVDHKRCVFVGNLDFVDEETVDNGDEHGSAKKKKKSGGDVEEGLWQAFGKAGVVESVRVIRDKATRVGKGFAYVQFKDENAVEAALLYNEKKFPPLLPRKIRVVRAKKIKKAVRRERAVARDGSNRKQFKTKFRREKDDKIAHGSSRGSLGGIKKPEAFVFEGHRASSVNSGKQKARENKKASKRPDNRSSRRAAAFKSTGGKRKREED